MSDKQVKVAAVIQARMGSTRRPGKMMELVAGQPVIWHIIERARRIQRATSIVLATTDLERDAPLVRAAEDEGILVVRGPEDNVLKRYMMALDATDADYIVRITGDALLFDTEFQDEWIEALIESGADYATVREGKRHAHEGAGTISANGLRWVWEAGREDPLAREHVTAYARAHEAEMNTVEVSVDPELIGDFHLSVDTDADLEFLRRVYDRLYVPGEIVSLIEVVRLIRSGEFVMPEVV